MAMFALSDAEVATVGKAFDRAWDSFLRTGALTPQNLWDSRNVLAARILRAVYYGERDEWRLARDAVSYLRQVTTATAPDRPRHRARDQRRQRPARKAPEQARATGLMLGGSREVARQEPIMAPQHDGAVADAVAAHTPSGHATHGEPVATQI
jgi:hypothetical protein